MTVHSATANQIHSEGYTAGAIRDTTTKVSNGAAGKLIGDATIGVSCCAASTGHTCLAVSAGGGSHLYAPVSTSSSLNEEAQRIEASSYNGDSHGKRVLLLEGFACTNRTCYLSAINTTSHESCSFITPVCLVLNGQQLQKAKTASTCTYYKGVPPRLLLLNLLPVTSSSYYAFRTDLHV